METVGLEALPEREVVAPRTTMPPGTTTMDDVSAFARSLRESMHEHMQLVALEARLAVQSLTTMIVAAVWLGVLLVTAWLGLMGAVAAMLIGFGLAPPIGFLAVAAMNLAAAPILYGLIRRKARDLEFPATLRALQPVARDA